MIDKKKNNFDVDGLVVNLMGGFPLIRFIYGARNIISIYSPLEQYPDHKYYMLVNSFLWSTVGIEKWAVVWVVNYPCCGDSASSAAEMPY